MLRSEGLVVGVSPSAEPPVPRGAGGILPYGLPRHERTARDTAAAQPAESGGAELSLAPDQYRVLDRLHGVRDVAQFGGQEA